MKRLAPLLPLVILACGAGPSPPPDDTPPQTTYTFDGYYGGQLSVVSRELSPRSSPRPGGTFNTADALGGGQMLVVGGVLPLNHFISGGCMVPLIYVSPTQARVDGGRRCNGGSNRFFDGYGEVRLTLRSGTFSFLNGSLSGELEWDFTGNPPGGEQVGVVVLSLRLSPAQP